MPLLDVMAGGCALPFTGSDSVRVVTEVAEKDSIWFSAPYWIVMPSPSMWRFFLSQPIRDEVDGARRFSLNASRSPRLQAACTSKSTSLRRMRVSARGVFG